MENLILDQNPNVSVNSQIQKLPLYMGGENGNALGQIYFTKHETYDLMKAIDMYAEEFCPDTDAYYCLKDRMHDQQDNESLCLNFYCYGQDEVDVLKFVSLALVQLIIETETISNTVITICDKLTLTLNEMIVEKLRLLSPSVASHLAYIDCLFESLTTFLSIIELCQKTNIGDFHNNWINCNEKLNEKQLVQNHLSLHSIKNKYEFWRNGVFHEPLFLIFDNEEPLNTEDFDIAYSWQVASHILRHLQAVSNNRFTLKPIAWIPKISCGLVKGE